MEMTNGGPHRHESSCAHAASDVAQYIIYNKHDHGVRDVPGGAQGEKFIPLESKRELPKHHAQVKIQAPAAVGHLVSIKSLQNA